MAQTDELREIFVTHSELRAVMSKERWAMLGIVLLAGIGLNLMNNRDVQATATASMERDISITERVNSITERVNDIRAVLDLQQKLDEIQRSIGDLTASLRMSQRVDVRTGPQVTNEQWEKTRGLINERISGRAAGVSPQVHGTPRAGIEGSTGDRRQDPGS